MAKETQNFTPERTISALFKQEEQVGQAIRRLVDRGIPQDYISVMGRDIQSRTRITGFISKKDIILGGLRTGAIFGSLFGSFLSLLTGVGVLFIPFVGSIVAGGPIGAVLLGAASGALAGSAGAGLVSVLTALGWPEEKAAQYETRLKAGEFLMMVEVPADKTGEIQLLLDNLGGQEIHTNAAALPRPCEGPCEGVEDLSPEVRSHLSESAQNTFVQRYNKALENGEDEERAEKLAWKTVYEQYDEDENGVWSKEKVAA